MNFLNKSFTPLGPQCLVLNLKQAGSGVPRVGSVLLQEVTELLDPEEECSPVL
jgi:hypothetical protein